MPDASTRPSFTHVGRPGPPPPGWVVSPPTRGSHVPTPIAERPQLARTSNASPATPQQAAPSVSRAWAQQMQSAGSQVQACPRHTLPSQVRGRHTAHLGVPSPLRPANTPTLITLPPPSRPPPTSTSSREPRQGVKTRAREPRGTPTATAHSPRRAPGDGKRPPLMTTWGETSSPPPGVCEPRS